MPAFENEVILLEWSSNKTRPLSLPMLKNQHMNGFMSSDLSKSAYPAQDIPLGLCDAHPAAVQTGRRAISQEALES